MSFPLDWEKPGGSAGSGTTPQATQTSVGTIQLAGDLSGTAVNPTVPSLSTKANTNHTHTDSDISNAGSVGKSVVESNTQGAALSAIGAAAVSHTHTDSDLISTTTVGRSVMEATSAASALASLGAVGGTGITQIQLLTQAAYNALGSYSSTTLYVIQG